MIEILAVFLGLAVMIVVQLFCGTGGSLMFVRPIWFDECLTAYLVRDPSFTHSMQALAGGVDTNAPLLYILLRGWCTIFGNDLVALRLFSMLCVLLALTLFYFVLKPLLGRIGATLGTILLWSQPVVIAQAFEVRFYGPMLLFIAMTAMALQLIATSQHSVAKKIFLALSCLLLCTIHYFGIIALALMLLGHIILRGTKSLWPALLGPIATAACIPLLLKQRSTLSIATWMGPLSWKGIERFSLKMLPPPLAIFFLAAAIFVLARKVHLKPYLHLLALLLLPIVLLLISLGLQPVLQDRYAIGFAVGLATFIAVALARAPRLLQALAVIVALYICIWQINVLAMQQRDVVLRLQQVQFFIAHEPEQKVIVQDPLDLLALLDLSPEVKSKMEYLEPVSGSPLPLRYNRQMMSNILNFYPITKAISIDQLPDSFIFIRSLEMTNVPPAQFFPGYSAITRYPGSWVYQMKRKP